MPLSNEELFTELTLKAAATISGGISKSNNANNSGVKSRIGKGRARIRVNLREGSPNKNISSEYGECRPDFDNLTGQFTFSCTLRQAGSGEDKLFPDL